MNKTLRRIVCLVLVACMLVSAALVLSSCKKWDVETFEGNYTYNDAVVRVSANWNPHTYQTTDESYPMDFISTGLYSFIFNDEVHPLKGKDPYDGYVIIPEMAAKEPVDITEKVKKDHPEFNIPADATEGYAYKIALNKDATWANGEAITADDYIYSMQQLLNPKLMNYRATDYFAGSLSIANAKKYYYQGTTQYDANDNMLTPDNGLTKGQDGNYYTAAGNPMYVAVYLPIAYFDGANAIGDYVDYYGDVYFDLTNWDDLVALADEDGVAPLNDTTYAYLTTLITGNPNWNEDESYLYNYLVEKVVYEADYSFENVGLYKSGEYEITLVLGKSLAGFQLLYNLSGNWLVYKPYYEAGMKQIEGTELWSTNYNTSLETTMSYGPYKMTGYTLDKEMTFEKNENWFGYSDGEHIYKDPTDGKVYPMYQTTKIYTQAVPEAATRKLMFLKGQLMGYGLQADDFAEYRDSEFCYATPSETIFFFIFNGYMDAIEDREEALDTTKYDLQTMTLTSFRKAVAVTYDKEALCTAVSPARSGGYGLIGDAYIYDPETGARYRDTEQAKKALCEFYSVNPDDFDSLDEAVDSITGYDPVKAKELYTQAFNDAIAEGYITDTNNDGKSDQTVQITYAASDVTDFINKTIDYLNEKMNEVTAGTPFEGKIAFVASAPLGDEWSNKLKAGLADTVLGGWSGSALDPFGLTDLYTNPAYQYDAKWFNASTINATLKVDVAGIGKKAQEKEITMSLKQWSDALNGKTVTLADGSSYCFGDGIAKVETRLDILAMIESQVLSTYNYIPMIQDAGMSLLSKQVYYVVDEYNPIMGRGGIAYMKYNYDDAAWAAYVDEMGGQLTY